MRRKDISDFSYEFGGPVGVSAMMIGFPLLMCESSTWLSLTAELIARLPVDLPLVL